MKSKAHFYRAPLLHARTRRRAAYQAVRIGLRGLDADLLLRELLGAERLETRGSASHLVGTRAELAGESNRLHLEEFTSASDALNTKPRI